MSKFSKITKSQLNLTLLLLMLNLFIFLVDCFLCFNLQYCLLCAILIAINSKFVKRTSTLSTIDIYIIGFIVIEFVLNILSYYPSNGYNFISTLLIFLSIYFLSDDTKILSILNNTLTILGLIVSVTYIGYVIFVIQSKNLWSSNLTDFKYLFSPFSISNGAWTSIFIGIIPFSYFLYCNSNSKIKSFYRFSTFPLLIALLFTFSRSAYLSVFIYLLVFLIINRANLIRKKKSLIFLALLLLPIIFLFNKSFFSVITMVGTESQRLSLLNRVVNFDLYFNLFKDNWALGIGSGNLSLFMDSYNSNASLNGEFYNIFIQIILEKGLLGLTLYLALFTIIIFWFFKYRIHYVFITAFCVILMREQSMSLIFSNQYVLLLFLLLILNIIKQSNIKFNELKFNKIEITVFLVSIIFIKCYYVFNIQVLANNYKTTRFLVREYYYKNKLDSALILSRSLNQNLIYNNYLTALISERIKNQNHKFEGIKSIKNINFSEEICLFQKAIKKDSFNAMFYNNIAWLYLYENKLDSSEYYFKKAFKRNSNDAYIYVGYGFLLQKINADADSIINQYCMAVRLNPELLDSKLFNDSLTITNEQNNKIIMLLKSYYKQQNTIKAKAVYGKLLFIEHKYDSSTLILNEVIKILPNLNRPYNTLAYISKLNNDTTSMLNHFNFSINANQYDYVPTFNLGNYYFAIKKNNVALNYYKKALACYISYQNSCKLLFQKKYHLICLDDNFIPYGFFDYCKPQLDLDSLLINMAIIYKVKGNENECNIINSYIKNKKLILTPNILYKL